MTTKEELLEDVFPNCYLKVTGGNCENGFQITLIGVNGTPTYSPIGGGLALTVENATLGGYVFLGTGPANNGPICKNCFNVYSDSIQVTIKKPGTGISIRKYKNAKCQGGTKELINELILELESDSNKNRNEELLQSLKKYIQS